jgi:hypothetical protein
VLTAAASDSDGTVSKVQFYNGTTLLGTATTSPYQFTWSNVPAGTYTLTAKATDDAGATSLSDPISISVNSASNISPVVTITTPENGANFIGGANITVNVAASDTDGSVSKVEFFNGTTLIGSDTTSPYQMTWNGVGAGNYSLKAKATDNAGASSWSPGISVVVTNDFKAKINFQPTSSVVPTGYAADGGAAYGNRGNGYTYGWNAINSSNAFDRNASNSPDQRYDTFVRMQAGGTFTWEIAVPNGTYNVRIVAGDPTYYAFAFYKINVEGVLTVNGAPLNKNRWIEGTSTVTVSDGKLTVSNASGSSNNKICFIEIFPVSP